MNEIFIDYTDLPITGDSKEIKGETLQVKDINTIHFDENRNINEVIDIFKKITKDPVWDTGINLDKFNLIDLYRTSDDASIRSEFTGGILEFIKNSSQYLMALKLRLDKLDSKSEEYITLPLIFHVKLQKCRDLTLTKKESFRSCI